MNEHDLLVIVPYLKSSESVSIRGIWFHPSQTMSEVEGLPDSVKNPLVDIFSAFYLQNEVQIERMLFAYLNLDPAKPTIKDGYNLLRQVRTLLGYFYSSPHFPVGAPFLSYEHSDMYIFQSSKIPKYIAGIDTEDPYRRGEDISEEPLDGFEAYKNFHSILWIAKGGRIYPSIPNFWLNISQDLSRDTGIYAGRAFHSPLLDLIHSSEPIDPELESRVFTAMNWYNLSTSQYFGEDFSIVALAVAFESLFDLDQGPDLAGRFNESVRLLVGRIPRIDSWAEQFYTARSKILHRGYWPHLGFYPIREGSLKSILQGKQEERFFRSLTSYGRMIFRICMHGILSSVLVGAEFDLRGLMQHNQDRLEDICRKLTASDQSPSDRLTSIAQDLEGLHEYWLESRDLTEIKSVLGAAKLIINTYLELEPEIPDTALSILRSSADYSGDSDYEHFELLRSADKAISELINSQEGRRVQANLQIATNILGQYLSFASMPGFILRTKWPSEQGDIENGSAS